MTALLFGLGLGIGGAFLIEMLNHGFTTRPCAAGARRKRRPREAPFLDFWCWRRKRRMPRTKRSARIVHVELDRVGGHFETGDFGHLQLDIAVDEIVIEHAAGLEERAILVEIFQSLAK